MASSAFTVSFSALLLVVVCVSGKEYTPSDWSAAIAAHNRPETSLQITDLKTKYITKINGLHSHFIAVLHEATEAAANLISGSLTRNESLAYMKRAAKKMNGSVILQEISGNLTLADQWFTDRSEDTKVKPETRRWFDSAARDLRLGHERAGKLAVQWKETMETLESLSDDDVDSHKGQAIRLLMAADDYLSVLFVKGTTFHIDAFYKQWSASSH